jgi:hypothetical protein
LNGLSQTVAEIRLMTALLVAVGSLTFDRHTMYVLDELEHFVRLSLEIGIVVVIFQAEKQDNDYHNNP